MKKYKESTKEGELLIIRVEHPSVWVKHGLARGLSFNAFRPLIVGKIVKEGY